MNSNEESRSTESKAPLSVFAENELRRLPTPFEETHSQLADRDGLSQRNRDNITTRHSTSGLIPLDETSSLQLPSSKPVSRRSTGQKASFEERVTVHVIQGTDGRDEDHGSNFSTYYHKPLSKASDEQPYKLHYTEQAATTHASKEIVGTREMDDENMPENIHFSTQDSDDFYSGYQQLQLQFQPTRRKSFFDNFRQPPSRAQNYGTHAQGASLNFRDSKKSSFSASVASSAGMSKYPNAREICETTATKMQGFLAILLVVFINSILVYFGNAMKVGVRVSISPKTVQYTGGVFVEIMLLLTNSLTIHAFDTAVAILLASRLTHKEGYSMASCGFMHERHFKRLSFTNQLSLNSPCRKTLQRLSFLWILLEAVKITSPVSL
jgi:hypothetical protein